MNYYPRIEKKRPIEIIVNCFAHAYSAFHRPTQWRFDTQKVDVYEENCFHFGENEIFEFLYDRWVVRCWVGKVYPEEETK